MTFDYCHSVDIVEASPTSVLWVSLLGDLVVGVMLGGLIGLVRWLHLPESTRGQPVGPLLRWIGIVFGLLLARNVFGIFWSWFWFFDTLFD